jgi:YHS domain-containing protein
MDVSLMVKDLVCGMDVDERKVTQKSVVNGKTYYFCSKACKVEFDKDPQKFIAQEQKGS